MFPQHQRRFEWWSPRIQPGLMALFDAMIPALDNGGTAVSIVANAEYADRVARLAARAGEDTKATGEPFYRALQILTDLRPAPEL